MGSGNRPLQTAFSVIPVPRSSISTRGHNQTISELIGEIGGRTLNGPLTDATGLTGKYDYTVFWSMSANTAALNPLSAAEPNGPSIFDAVQDQLGRSRRRGIQCKYWWSITWTRSRLRIERAVPTPIDCCSRSVYHKVDDFRLIRPIVMPTHA